MCICVCACEGECLCVRGSMYMCVSVCMRGSVLGLHLEQVLLGQLIQEGEVPSLT